MVHIPADIFHSTVNMGWEPLKLIAVYSPPGPDKGLDISVCLQRTRIVPGKPQLLQQAKALIDFGLR